MKKFVILLILLMLASPVLAQENWNEAFTFIIAADMREYASEEYHGDSRYFWGACEAIKEVGKGAFMVSPGDIDPPGAVRNVITQVLGEDYPWYPVIGNHEIEDRSFVEYLRQYNKDGKALPNLVRSGPPGCEETTYSFDWANCHFIALNEYYDGKSDIGTDGDIVPELLDWLKQDLAANKKRHVFVFGHEPIMPMPDMDNGRVRHLDNSLNKYRINMIRFHKLMREHDVVAYSCGHTHGTSVCKINGLWQLDAGHARGIEDESGPERLFNYITNAYQEGQNLGLTKEQALTSIYNKKKKKIDNLFSMSGIETDSVINTLAQFYLDYQENPELKENYVQTFWKNTDYGKSSFLKIYAGKDKVKVEVYRNDGHGGPYSLTYSEILE